jgi:hypothetical protein
MSKSSFIYLAHQENSPYYKIGSSDNPQERIKQLQTANGELLELIEIFNMSGIEIKNTKEKLLDLIFNDIDEFLITFRLKIKILPNFFYEHNNKINHYISFFFIVSLKKKAIWVSSFSQAMRNHHLLFNLQKYL